MGKMFLLGWWICCSLLIQCVSAGDLEISDYNSDDVICSEGLSDCTMKDCMPFPAPENYGVGVQNLTPYFRHCCKDGEMCTLCLLIDTEISIHVDNDMQDEGHSGLDDEDFREEENPKASVTVCYNMAQTLPTCKQVEFTVNRTALTQQNQAKLFIVITQPAWVSYSSHVIVYSESLSQEVVVISQNEVCSQKLKERVKECQVPRLNTVINQKMNRVELQSADSNNSLLSMCIQYENNGRCQRWNTMTIPLYSVTPCMCFQVWNEDGQTSKRSKICPFVNTDFLKGNIWQNISVSVSQSQINSHSMLWWNLSAPCRLEGEVWPCHRDIHCREIEGFRQQLTNDKWKQNNKEQWEKGGVFEDINLQRSPCVMVTVKGMGRKLGPFCFKDTDRWHWSLLAVGIMLVTCLAVLIFYFLRDFVKKWVWSWHHETFVETGRKRHVVLLSPPDVGDGVSESVCQLGSLLGKQGFSVSVDQWSRTEQCNLGPLPWLHSQLLELKSKGGRVVLILTAEALERTEEWTHQHREVIEDSREDRGLLQIGSPYSDVFMASLCLIQADKQLDKARERFVLVTFDSNSCKNRSLPELLRGLQLFQLPSQFKALLTELTVGGARTESGGNKVPHMDGEQILKRKQTSRGHHSIKTLELRKTWIESL